MGPSRGRCRGSAPFVAGSRGSRSGACARSANGLVIVFADLLTMGLRLVSGGQAGRMSVLAEDEAAVAECRGTGNYDGQRQRLAGQIQDAGPDMFAEQEHAEQAG